MKLKIYVKRFKDENGTALVSMPAIIKKGDWVDLCAAESVVLQAPQAGTLKGKELITAIKEIMTSGCFLL